ncbi:g12193 [Coccomyxa viridis]|uniref:G12193 protein n=1 Tax=Coccomyxa viridis TaxID=1274662 RepID=A0ABP1G9S6_9CHLO
MGRRCVRRLLAMLSENVEPAEGGSYRELAGSERPGTGKGRFYEAEDPSRGERHRRHHHPHPDGHEAGGRRHGRRHPHRRHEDTPNQAAAPAVVATGMPAESPAIGYPEIYKARDEEPERPAHPVHRRHRHGDHGVHVHHHIHGEAPPPHLQERHRRHGCRRHSHRCRSREHVHYHYDRDSARTSEGIPCPVAVGQPAAQPTKPTDTITRRSSI